MKSAVRFLLLAVLLFPSPASAALFFFSSAGAGVDVYQGPFFLASDSDFLQVTGTDTLGPISASASALGNSGSSWASVVDGTLHGAAAATDLSSVDGTSVHAVSNAFFSDTLLITSRALAVGTAVQLRFDAVLSATVSPCSPSTVAVAFVSLSSGSFIQDHSCSENDFHTPTSFVWTTVGAELQVYASLNVQAGSGGGSATANAANTAKFFVTPLGDFSFTSGSGNTYQEPVGVPEPASLILLGTGLLVARARRVRLRRA